jgi:hypothetical protein
MAFQVVSFLRRSSRAVDWTREELAELYRIEHALVQANIAVGTDRGLSDEDDPWFVFCRADGEVLVHICRYDGQYRLHSPGLSNPLIGQSFVELAKSFTKIVPIQVSIQRREGAQLFIHPAAMLAAIVGTLFVVADDLHLFSSRHDADSAAASSDDTPSAGGSSFKFALHAAFDSYINAFLGSLQEMAANESSYYLALISTVTAFVLGSTFDAPDQLLSATAADMSALADGSSAQDGSSVPPAAAVPDDISGSKFASDDGNAQKIAFEMAAQQSTEKDGQADVAQQTGIAGVLNKLPHASDQAGQFHQDGAIQVYQDDIVLPVKPFEAGSSYSSAVESVGLLKLASGNLIQGNPLPRDSSISASASGNSISDILLGEASAGNSEIQALLSHALNDVFSPTQNLVLINAVLMTSAPDAATATFASSTTTSSTTTSSTTTSSTAISSTATSSTAISSTATSFGSSQYPIYDAAAQTILDTFLKANPQAGVIFDHGNMVVFDGLFDSTSPMIVDAWEFGPGGPTISIVGHAGYGLVAT